MSEVTSTDLIRLIFSSSPTLVSVTVVILAYFLSEYSKVRDLGEKKRRPYFISAILMALTSFFGFCETLLSLSYLSAGSLADTLTTQFQAIIVLFILMMIGIISGAIILLIKVLR